MASEKEEIFWAIANVGSIINAVVAANKKAGVTAANQLERDWVTISTIAAKAMDTPENLLEAEAQAHVDILFEELAKYKIVKGE